MAVKKQSVSPADAKPGEKQELFDVDELRKKHKISRAIFTGTCCANRWKSGKAITEDEFLAGVKHFTQTPTDGKRGNS